MKFMITFYGMVYCKITVCLDLLYTLYLLKCVEALLICNHLYQGLMDQQTFFSFLPHNTSQKAGARRFIKQVGHFWFITLTSYPSSSH